MKLNQSEGKKPATLPRPETDTGGTRGPAGNAQCSVYHDAFLFL